MKKVLLSLTLLATAFLGHTQVILNEMWTSPQGTNQFVELYNVGNDVVDLSCYYIVSFQISNGSPQRVTKINIIDFPDAASIPSKGYYTLGEAATLMSQSMNYNWNASPQPSGPSFKNYNVTNNANGTTVTISTGTIATGDFALEATGNTKLAVFLFDGSALGKDASGNIRYVNGLIGYGNLAPDPPLNPALPGVPSSFNLANFPILDVTGNTCGTAKIDWSKLTTSEYSEAASGNNHGYERLANGLCGTWQKITSGYSPNSRNRLGTNTTSTSGTITATETALCNGVAYSISAYTDAIYPLTLQLYYDDGDGVLEDGEEREVIATVNSLPATGQFTYTSPLPAGSVPVIAYKTPFGCFSRVFRATNTSNLVTNQYNICNTQAAFSITNADALTTNFGFPVSVQYLYDGAPLGGPITVEGVSPNVYYSPTFADPTKLSIRYTPANCQSVTTVANATSPAFTLVTGSLSTTESVKANAPTAQNLVDITVDITAITSSIQPQSSSVFPVEVRLYIDNNPDNSTPDTAFGIDPTSYLGSIYFQTIDEAAKSFTAADLNRQFTSDDYDKDIYIVYKPSLACFGKSVKKILPAPAAPLPVRLKSFNAKRQKEKVLLTWETTMELNNSGFDIQRKLGNGEWKTVAFVFSQSNGGNSNSVLTYEYDDINTAKGISQYRLRQVDIDTRYTLSEIRSVHGLEQANKVMVYPNPSTEGTVNIIFDDQASSRTVKVSDISGRIIKQYGKITDNSLQINNLQNGIYTIQITNNSTGEINIEKVIVKKR